MINEKVFKYDDKTELLIKGYVNFRGEFFAESTMHIPKKLLPDVCDTLWPHSMAAMDNRYQDAVSLFSSKFCNQ